MAETETFSLRLTPDLKLRFQETIKNSNLKQEEFVTTLLSAYEAQGEDQAGTVSQEKSQVRSGLERLRILLEAVIDRAEDQSQQAVSDVEQTKEAHDEEKKGLKQLIEEQAGRIETIEAENSQLKENEESRDALKQAFQEKEAVWATREQDAKTKIAKLTDRASSLSAENIRLRKDIDALKKDRDELNTTLTSSQNDHQLKLKDIKIEAQSEIAALTLKLKQECDARIEDTRAELKEQLRHHQEIIKTLAESATSVPGVSKDKKRRS